MAAPSDPLTGWRHLELSWFTSWTMALSAWATDGNARNVRLEAVAIAAADSSMTSRGCALTVDSFGRFSELICLFMAVFSICGSSGFALSGPPSRPLRCAYRGEGVGTYPERPRGPADTPGKGRS